MTAPSYYYARTSSRRGREKEEKLAKNKISGTFVRSFVHIVYLRRQIYFVRDEEDPEVSFSSSQIRYSLFLAPHATDRQTDNFLNLTRAYLASVLRTCAACYWQKPSSNRATVIDKNIKYEDSSRNVKEQFTRTLSLLDQGQSIDIYTNLIISKLSSHFRYKYKAYSISTRGYF